MTYLLDTDHITIGSATILAASRGARRQSSQENGANFFPRLENCMTPRTPCSPLIFLILFALGNHPRFYAPLPPFIRFTQ